MSTHLLQKSQNHPTRFLSYKTIPLLKTHDSIMHPLKVIIERSSHPCAVYTIMMYFSKKTPFQPQSSFFKAVSVNVTKY